MKLRSETDYAIRVIRALINANGQPMISKEIAINESIPQNYILTIVAKLKRAQIIDIAKKTNKQRGGYYLKTDPSTLTLFHIVEAFEGEICIDSCLREQNDYPTLNKCNLKQEMLRINNAIIEEFKRTPLTEILKNVK